MDKVAALSDTERSELFSEAARQRGVHPAIIEKDFWVCWALKNLFASEPLANNLVFKGGTSLSKVYKIIDRFSEDVDLVLNWELLGYGPDQEDPWKVHDSQTQQIRFNKEFDLRANEYLRNTFLPLLNDLFSRLPGIRSRISDEPQAIDVKYPAAFRLDALRPDVKLEIGPLASWVPSDRFEIRPYAAEEFPDVFENPICTVVALRAERTFWEKATILHQQAHRTSQMPPEYSRHYYDLHRLASSPIKSAALQQLNLLSDVVSFKQRFYPCNWAQYEDARPGSFRLLPSTEGGRQLETDYRRMQDLIFGVRPSWTEISAGLGQLEQEINDLPKRV